MTAPEIAAYAAVISSLVAIVGVGISYLSLSRQVAYLKSQSSYDQCVHEPVRLAVEAIMDAEHALATCLFSPAGDATFGGSSVVSSMLSSGDRAARAITNAEIEVLNYDGSRLEAWDCIKPDNIHTLLNDFHENPAAIHLSSLQLEFQRLRKSLTVEKSKTRP